MELAQKKSSRKVYFGWGRLGQPVQAPGALCWNHPGYKSKVSDWEGWQW
jgi:hypothetical protein